MPCLSVAVELGQPAHEPFMLRKTTPSEAMKSDVAAILGDRRPDPGFQQFLDGADNGLVGLVENLVAGDFAAPDLASMGESDR